jgi:hypothetical protein
MFTLPKEKPKNHLHTIVFRLINEQFGYVIPLSNYSSLYNFKKLQIEPYLLNLHGLSKQDQLHNF